MSFTPGVGIDPTVSAATAGDEDAFAALVRRHRRELHVHCYRMLGSFEEAEDRVQETFLRAWHKRDTFEGRSSYRAWLYRIATNACLELLRRQPRKVLTAGKDRIPPYSSVPWLQPYPDQLLDELEAIDEGPDAIAISRETIGLAFLTLIQLLPTKQRAVLIMRDILTFSAAETAEILEDSVPAVNSALQRARATLKKYRTQDSVEMPGNATDEERRLVQVYMDAHERGDAAAVVALLADEARLTISPMGLAWDGKDEIGPDVTANMNSLGEFRNLATWANRQPAVAHYLRAWGDDEYRAFTLVVMGIEDGALVEWATFVAPELFEFFGLPATL